MMSIAMTVLAAMAMLLVTGAGRVGDDRLHAAHIVASRLWISPVRVSVKKRKGIRWRWAYSSPRRSWITLWPMTLFRYVWPTPISPDTIGRTIIRPTKQIEQPPVALRDRDVDEELEQDRVDQADEARGQDRDQDDDDLSPVGPKKRTMRRSVWPRRSAERA